MRIAYFLPMDINIKTLRKSRGWTRQEMADHFGVNLTTVLRWENKGVPERGAARRAILREFYGVPSTNHTATSPEAA